MDSTPFQTASAIVKSILVISDRQQGATFVSGSLTSRLWSPSAETTIRLITAWDVVFSSDIGACKNPPRVGGLFKCRSREARKAIARRHRQNFNSANQSISETY
jgi:hypothetical protein